MESMLRLFAVLQCLVGGVLILVVLWCCCALSAQISRMEERRDVSTASTRECKRFKDPEGIDTSVGE